MATASPDLSAPNGPTSQTTDVPVLEHVPKHRPSLYGPTSYHTTLSADYRVQPFSIFNPGPLAFPGVRKTDSVRLRRLVTVESHQRPTKEVHKKRLRPTPPVRWKAHQSDAQDSDESQPICHANLRANEQSPVMQSNRHKRPSVRTATSGSNHTGLL